MGYPELAVTMLLAVAAMTTVVVRGTGRRVRWLRGRKGRRGRNDPTLF
jgi:hypothetical protein